MTSRTDEIPSPNLGPPPHPRPLSPGGERGAIRVFVYEHISAGGMGPDVPASLLREGRAMFGAVCADFRRLPGIEVVTPSNSMSFEACATSCDWTLVIAPEFDDVLRDLSRTVLDVGGRLLGSQPGAIELTADKLALANFWHMRGVAHPATAWIEAPLNHAPPWVVKPRQGAGSQATFVIRDVTAWPRVVAEARREWPGGELIQQTYIEGEAASVALLVGANQVVPLLPGRQHLSRDDRLHYEGGSLPLPRPLAGRALRVATEAVRGIDGLRGYIGVDLVLSDDGDCVIEINPRLTTSYLGLRQLCRGNLAELMLRCARGDDLDAPQWEDRELRFAACGVADD